MAGVDEIRAAFPALLRRHNGVPVAYFDGPGGTQVPQAVADAMSDYLLHHNANTHWHYPTSQETDAALAAARSALALASSAGQPARKSATCLCSDPPRWDGQRRCSCRRFRPPDRRAVRRLAAE